MDCSLIAESIPLEYYTIRAIVLKYLSVEKISSLDYKFLYPLEKTDRGSLSLTDRINPDNQIRFYLRNRTLKVVSELAKKITETGIEEADLSKTGVSSQLKNHFISSLIRMNVSVKFLYHTKSESSALTLNEISLIKEILKGKNGNVTLILDAIKKSSMRVTFLLPRFC